MLRIVGARVFASLLLLTGIAAAQECSTRQTLDEAWWTGPMLAASAATLPRGHMLIEPYFFDVTLQGHLDHDGVRRDVPHVNGLGTLTYINYGLTDKFTVGLIPTTTYNILSGGPSSSGMRMGDLTINSQYRLRKYHPGSWIPMMGLNFQETLPTSKFDGLTRASDGIGGGAFTSTVGLYMQQYYWLPNGRILRGRLNISQSFSQDVKLKDASVYGTDPGFRGKAEPGRSFIIDNAWEYSLTKHWVLASDIEYRHDGTTRVSGLNLPDPGTPVNFESGTSHTLWVAPAVEYNLNSKLGVLLGVRLTPAGRNTSSTITPAIAINFVH